MKAEDLGKRNGAKHEMFLNCSKVLLNNTSVIFLHRISYSQWKRKVEEEWILLQTDLFSSPDDTTYWCPVKIWLVSVTIKKNCAMHCLWRIAQDLHECLERIPFLDSNWCEIRYTHKEAVFWDCFFFNLLYRTCYMFNDFFGHLSLNNIQFCNVKMPWQDNNDDNFNAIKWRKKEVLNEFALSKNKALVVSLIFKYSALNTWGND